MSEHFPDNEPTELDTIELGGRSLRMWHDYLTHEEGEMGMPTGHLSVQGSRYGSTTEEVSWWAIAAEVARVDATGEADDPEASLDELMSAVVNDDNGDAAGLIAEYWHAIPQALRDHLGDEDDVRRLDG